MQIQYSIFKAPCPGEEKVGGQGSGGPSEEVEEIMNHHQNSKL